jgi:hypothetical protein
MAYHQDFWLAAATAAPVLALANTVVLTNSLGDEERNWDTMAAWDKVRVVVRRPRPVHVDWPSLFAILPLLLSLTAYVL